MTLLHRLFRRRARPRANLPAPPPAAAPDMIEILLMIKLPCC